MKTTPHGAHAKPSPAAPERQLAAVTDPVCGMTVDPDTAKWRHRHAGQPYYFCSKRCQERFAADPTLYLRPLAAPEPPPGAIYTCPMHPEVRQPGPGSCPICGMALEPLLGAPDAGPDPELVDMTRRFRIGWLFTLPLLLLDMGSHLGGFLPGLPRQGMNWIELLLATPVVLWAGWPFLQRGWASLKTRHLNMFTLIAMGTGVAWAYSVLGTIWPALFPAPMRGADGSIAVYFEAAAVITQLVLLGQVLEGKARTETGGANRARMARRPQTAHGTVA